MSKVSILSYNVCYSKFMQNYLGEQVCERDIRFIFATFSCPS